MIPLSRETQFIINVSRIIVHSHNVAFEVTRAEQRAAPMKGRSPGSHTKARYSSCRYITDEIASRNDPRTIYTALARYTNVTFDINHASATIFPKFAQRQENETGEEGRTREAERSESYAKRREKEARRNADRREIEKRGKGERGWREGGEREREREREGDSLRRIKESTSE